VYDPKLIDKETLQKDHDILHGWWEDFQMGKEVQLSPSDVRKLHDAIAEELEAREVEHTSPLPPLKDALYYKLISHGVKAKLLNQRKETLEQRLCGLKEITATLSASELELDVENSTLSGIALSPGVWSDSGSKMSLYYSPEVIRRAPLDTLVGKPVNIEHLGEGHGVIRHVVVDSENNIRVVVDVDDKAKEEIKRGKKFFSFEGRVLIDPIRRVVREIKQFRGIALVDNPACKVCSIDNCT